jgi:uncharacterized protein (TIGR02594 family)
MKSLTKTALILTLLLGATAQSVAEPTKVSIKQAEKYCNLSAQTKYAHLAKYCKNLVSVKIQKPVNNNNYNEEDTAASYFRQEKIRAESSNFFAGWTELPAPVPTPSTKNKKREVVKYTTTTKLSNTKPHEKPYRRQSPTPTPPPEPVRIARGWEGYDVHKNKVDLIKLLSKGNDGKVDPTRIPWCAAFMNAVLKESGYEGTNSLMARSFLSYGTKVRSPEEGDIVIFKRGASSNTGHVAFFVGYEYINNKMYIKALGGNQNKAVKMVLYPVEKLIGVRRIS